MNVERVDVDEWVGALPDRGFEVFHLPAALETAAEHTPGDLHLYAGYKGDQPVGLCPVFVRRRAVGTALLSPPPRLAIPRLGPLVMPTSPKQRKRERVNRRFTEGLLEELDVDGSLTLLRMACPTTYRDPRPYAWADLEVDTSFTYHLDVDGVAAEDLLGSFSKSLRREIRDARELDVTVERAGDEGVRAVYDDTVARYDEQDRSFGLSWPYVRDLREALGDRFRTYVARAPNGTYLSGITVLYSNDAAYFWQGGARADYEGVSVNSLVHWAVIRDLIDDPPVTSVSRYDLMGANTERLCRYKSKFGADLTHYYVVESSGRGMDVAKSAYRMVGQ